MVTLEVLKKNENDEYLLKERKTGKKFSLVFVFYDSAQPEMGDVIVLHESLLDRKSNNFCQPYYFGGLENSFGRESEILGDDELLYLHCKDKQMIFKRLYG